MAEDATPISDDGDVAAQLRSEYLAERREEERDALRLHWRSRRLADVLGEAMRSGDTVTIDTGSDRLLSGRIVDIGSDVAVVDTGHGRVATRVPAHGEQAGPPRRVTVTQRARSGGTSGLGGPPTLCGQLRQLELDQEISGGDAVITLIDATVLRGRVRAVAVDHLYVDAIGGETFVPLAEIATVAHEATADLT